MLRHAPPSLSHVHAVVPVRGLADGKERLGDALDAEEREALILGMLLATIAALETTRPPIRTHVVSRDEELLRMCAGAGAAVLAEDRPGDLNAGLRSGRAAALEEGATAVLYLSADLPLISRDDITALLDAADAALAAGHGQPVAVIAPSEVGGGTNALLACPPLAVEPSFGPASLEAHVRGAAANDASVQLVVEPALGFDLDTPDDLERLDATRLVELLERGATALAATEVG